MNNLLALQRIAWRALTPVCRRLAPIAWKEYSELAYWKCVTRAAGRLRNDHYQHFYTAHFGLDVSFYQNKVVLDIGCGPRGSLAWATMAERRIGIDPLADDYVRLGANPNEMEYVAAYSERLPIADAACDVVCSFNSLDHVRNVAHTIREIKRVTRPGGLFLLLVEVNHRPTACEPHQLHPTALEALRPEFDCHGVHVCRPVRNGIYESLLVDDRYPVDDSLDRRGYLSAKYVRRSTSAPTPTRREP